MKSIRQRLTVGLLGVFVVLMSAGGTLIYLLTRTALLAQVDARLRIEALAVIKQTKQEREDEHESATSDLNPASEASPRRELEVGFTDKYLPEFKDGGTEFFQVWSPDGKTVKRSSSLHNTDLPRRAGPLDKPAFWSFRLNNGAAVRAVGLTFVPPTPARERNWHDPNFRATLVMATELGELNETLAVLRGILIGVGGLGLLATLAVVPGFLRRGLLPLQKVALHAAGLEATTFANSFSYGRHAGRATPDLLTFERTAGSVGTKLRTGASLQRRRRPRAAHADRRVAVARRGFAQVAGEQ